jgi:tRNA A-37 threonylcarbamoyl transferase component Bud32
MTVTQPAPPLPPARLAAPTPAAVLGVPHARVVRLDWNGRPVWLKRPEVPPSLRWRLQKGDPMRAFRREAAGLRLLAGLGVPVPRIVGSGADFLILEDAGPTLETLFAAAAGPGAERGAAERIAAVQAAAAVLAGLHRRGLAHGRPYLRDICWDGAAVTLIDFERFRPQGGAGRQGFDIVLFLASLLGTPEAARADAAAACDAALRVFRAQAPAPALRAAGRWMTLLRLLRPLGRLAQRLRPHDAELRGYLELAQRRIHAAA